MSRTTKEPNAASLLRDLYAPIETELEQVEQVLRDELRSEHAYVDELVRYGCLLGGKRLRPALLLLSGKAVGKLTQDHIVLAAVVEMIHTATLVHDDVLDEADTRRHLATVNSRWDNKASILLGDYLFTHAFYLASTRNSTWACREIGLATNIVCEGELRQKGSRGDYQLGETEYLDIIASKTAELCACSCRLGSHYSGATPDVVERFTRFGRDLGIAFQIADDVLDLLGEEKTVGKSLGTDLEQQKPTLPLIRLLELASASERQEVLSILNRDGRESIGELMPLLRRHGAIEYALATAQRYASSAAAAIEFDEYDCTILRTLRQVTDFVVNRPM